MADGQKKYLPQSLVTRVPQSFILKTSPMAFVADHINNTPSTIATRTVLYSPPINDTTKAWRAMHAKDSTVNWN